MAVFLLEEKELFPRSNGFVQQICAHHHIRTNWRAQFDRNCAALLLPTLRNRKMTGKKENRLRYGRTINSLFFINKQSAFFVHILFRKGRSWAQDWFYRTENYNNFPYDWKYDIFNKHQHEMLLFPKRTIYSVNQLIWMKRTKAEDFSTEKGEIFCGNTVFWYGERSKRQGTIFE